MAAKKPNGDCGGEMDGEFAVRLIHVLNHRVRRQILRLLAETDEALSPAVMSKMLGIPLSTVSYHVNILKRCCVVELTNVQQVRGAIEHFYKTLLEKNKVARSLLQATRTVDEPDTK